MAETASAREAVHTLGLLDGHEELKRTSVIEPWHRGGAETYICIFDVEGRQGSVCRVLFKSFVPDVLSVPEATAAARTRRDLLLAAGVLAPRLYGESPGTWLEQYVPLPLAHAIQTLPLDDAASSWLLDLMTYASALDHLGFSPTAPLSDLRTDGSRIYAVDFGQDLGEPGVRRTPACQQAVMSWIEGKRPDAVLLAWDALDQARQRVSDRYKN